MMLEEEEKIAKICLDLLPARYIFFVNVPARMRKNSEDLYIWQTHL